MAQAEENILLPVFVFTQGTGKITINGRDIDDYFGLETLKLIVRQPSALTDTIDKYDIVCTRCRRRRYRSGRRYPTRSFQSASSVLAMSSDLSSRRQASSLVTRE